MAFSPKNWQNLPNNTTPVSAPALTDLEVRVTDYADEVAAEAQFNATNYTGSREISILNQVTQWDENLRDELEGYAETQAAQAVSDANAYTDAEIAAVSIAAQPLPWITVAKATGRSHTNVAANELIPFVVSDDVGSAAFVEKNIMPIGVGAAPTERYANHYTPEGRTGNARLKVTLYTTDSFPAQTVGVRLKTVALANFSAGSGNYRLYINSLGADLIPASYSHAGGKRADVFYSANFALSVLDGFHCVSMDGVTGLTSAAKIGINVEVQTKITG